MTTWTAHDVLRHGGGPYDRRQYWLRAGRWCLLAEHARAVGASPESVLVAAFAEVVRTWLDQPGIPVGYRDPADGLVPYPVAGVGTGRPLADTARAVHRQLTDPAPARMCLPAVVTTLDNAGRPVPPAPGAALDFSFRQELLGGLYIRWEFTPGDAPEKFGRAFVGFRQLLDRLPKDHRLWAADGLGSYIHEPAA
jgi:hypothetical protein